jgi:lysophospholipase L1-like esterase
MKILTVGDSFTYGDELQDRECTAWPYVLGNLTNSQVTNIGKSGCGNQSILRRTLEHISESNSYDMVIIGWTSPGRIEWQDSIGGEYDIWPAMVAEHVCRAHSWRKDFIDYITKHHDPVFLCRQYLVNIISLQSFFQANNIKYMMLDTVSNEYYKLQSINKLQTLVNVVNKEHFIGWGNTGMAEIAYGTPKGPKGHPLEDGHQKIAEHINEHIRNLGWLS